MASSKNSDSLKNKLIMLRVVAVILVAFLLVKFRIVTNTMPSSNGLGLYIFALIISLPVVALFDKYLIKLAKAF